MITKFLKFKHQYNWKVITTDIAQKRLNNPSVKGRTSLSALPRVYRSEAWTDMRTRLWTGFSRTLSRTIGSTDRSGGRHPIPVGPMDVGIVATKVMTGETEIMVGEGTVRRYEITVVVGNATVIANRAPRFARQVAAEWADACVELLEDNGLGFDFTNLLRDDSDLDKWATAIFQNRLRTDLLAISWRTRRRCCMITTDSEWQTTSCCCSMTIVL